MQLTLLCPWGQVGAAGKEPEAWPSWGFWGEVAPVSDFQTSDLRCHGAVISPCQACSLLYLVL